MKSKFIYTEDDIRGCTVQTPDFNECKECLFNNEDTPIRCLVFKQMKPSSVIYDRKPCDKKRTE